MDKTIILIDSSTTRKKHFSEEFPNYNIQQMEYSVFKEQFKIDVASSVVIKDNIVLLINRVENEKQEFQTIHLLEKYSFLALIVAKLIKNNDNKLSTVSIIAGIIVNLILVLLKVGIGFLTNSLAFISDGMNNFADFLNSLIAFIGLKLSFLPPDKDHPFGHGRIEYLSSLLVAILIMISGAGLVFESYRLFINPEPLIFRWSMIIVVIISIILKYGLMLLNQYFNLRTQSVSFSVIAKDARNDILLSSVLLINIFVFHFFAINLDALTGLFISVMIIKCGYDILVDMIDRLIGKKIDQPLYTAIKNEVLKSSSALSVHDLVLHFYGAQNYFGSIHVEVDSTKLLLELHQEFDIVEKIIFKKFKVRLVIHLDPIELQSTKRSEVYRIVNGLLPNYYFEYDLHDFRFVSENEIEFDLQLDFKYKSLEPIVVLFVEKAIKRHNNDYCVTIHFEYV